MNKRKLENNPPPVVELKDVDGGLRYRVYVLEKGQYMTSPANPKHSLDGPGLIHVEYGPNGIHSFEGWPNDGPTWKWIERLMQKGYSAYEAEELNVITKN